MGFHRPAQIKCKLPASMADTSQYRIPPAPKANTGPLPYPTYRTNPGQFTFDHQHLSAFR
ncbi:hypothetical protein [Ancylothrix sp. D3o]|uniref:hypothetical protein n=1 Tax=Ancylothrix sp. D3o TaxID=2953691 RepID=UPI0021BA8C13|nr:hypothetical protein [Ancylothrix sp. D3o]